MKIKSNSTVDIISRRLHIFSKRWKMPSGRGYELSHRAVWVVSAKQVTKQTRRVRVFFKFKFLTLCRRHSHPSFNRDVSFSCSSCYVTPCTQQGAICTFGEESKHILYALTDILQIPSPNWASLRLILADPFFKMLWTAWSCSMTLPKGHPLNRRKRYQTPQQTTWLHRLTPLLHH